jgi:hypothetical protein
MTRCSALESYSHMNLHYLVSGGKRINTISNEHLSAAIESEK